MVARREARIIEASLLLSSGVSEDSLVADSDYGEHIVDGARRKGLHGLHAPLGEFLRLDGKRPKHGGEGLWDCIPKGSQYIEAEGFSSLALPGILGNVANKLILDAFTHVDSTYTLIAEQAEFSNFHTHSIYRLDMLGDFQLVPKDSELKHASLGQTQFSNKLETYGEIITLTRQDIINDDLQAFASLPQQIGRKAKLAIERAIYGQVMEAADSFYTVTQGNRLLNNPLDIEGLANADAALRMMADASSDPIFATGKVLLVPPQLRFLASQIYTSENVMQLSSGHSVPTANVYRGVYPPVTSPYLAAPSLPGSSASAWYLLADPLILPAFQVATLIGSPYPTTETKDARFDTLGLSLRVFWDFGVTRLDARGAIKSSA
jgi:hypothetical protein